MLAKNVEIIGRRIALAIQAIVVEQAHSAVMHQGHDARRVDLAGREREKTREGVDARNDGVGMTPQLREAREVRLDDFLRDAQPRRERLPSSDRLLDRQLQLMMKCGE